MKNFYTYAYLREDRTPYYIGKGSGNRAYRRTKKCIKPPKDKSRIILLKQNLTEEEAFRHEKYMINVFGRKDLGTGILHNRTNGGDGTSGYKHTSETKQLLRYQKINKKQNLTPEGLEKRREIAKSINLGRSLSEEEKQKISNDRKTYYENLGGYPEEVKENQRKQWRKWWRITSPTGEVWEVYTTIREFCKKNNIERSKFNRSWTFEELAQGPLWCP
jgi:hypothetical protein